ncbi:MAG: ABC transporter ATP-binding protein [Deltaproteobacteria bacterium]
MSEAIPVISISGLAKTYRSNENVVPVLRDVTMEIHRGEVVAIVGASGVGKTTLLHILGTLDHPSSGTVLHFGENVFSWPDRALSRFRNEKIGFVFQFHRLLPEFTALENVMLPCLVARVPRREAAEKAEAILRELGMGERLGHRTGQLSGGEQQRVALARAMVRDPSIILADEPTGNLDETTGRKVADLFFSMNKRYSLTMVIVTHNLALAERMDRRLGLRDGQVRELEASELKAFGVGNK